MTEFSRRVAMRALMEDPYFDHDLEIGTSAVTVDDARHVPPDVHDRVAHLEREDTDNPIAQTMQVRPDLELTLDVAAVAAQFPQEDK